MRISGVVNFTAVNRPLDNVTIRVRLERTTLADAPATVLAETELNAVNITPAGRMAVPFTLETPPLDENESYTLRAHADTTGNGLITVGDFVTTQAYPVNPAMAGTSMQIEVKPVT